MTRPGLRANVLITSDDHGRILAEPMRSGARLPRFVLDTSDDDTAVMLVNRLLEERMSLSAPVLETHLPGDGTGPAPVV